ncbi:MAG: carboxypeptidase-like regulatory domain-containing protein [Planctomycetota bacterium]
MRARDSLLALTIAALAGAVLFLLLVLAPAELGPATVEAAAPARPPAADAPPMGGDAGGPANPGAGEAEAAPRAVARVEVPDGREPPDTGEFAADALYGRVADKAKNGIPGAAVHLLQERPGAATTWNLLELRTTDEDGRFRFTGREEFRRQRLLVTAEGFLPAWESRICGRDGTIELKPATRIAGRVLDAATSAPLAGVELRVEAAAVEEGEVLLARRVVSDEQGRYALEPVRTEGQQRITARRPLHKDEAVEVQIAPGRTEGYDLRLRAQPTLFLEFCDLATGTLLAGMEIEVDGLGPRATDAGGRIEVALLPRSWRGGRGLSFSAAAPGWCRTQATVALLGDALPPLVRVPLSRGGVVRGRVSLPGGGGIEGARVSLTSPRGRPLFGPGPAGPGAPSAPTLPGLPPEMSLADGASMTRTDASGDFRLEGLVRRPGPVTLRASHPSYRTGQREDVAVPAPGEEVVADLELERGAIVQGTVRVNGAPAARGLSWRSEQDRGDGQSNDRGAYRLNGIPPGKLRLSVFEEEGAWYSNQREEEDQLWIEANAVVDHDVERFTTRSVISGTVREAVGEPIAGVEVYAAGEDDVGGYSGGSDTSAEDGSFALELPPLAGRLFYVWAQKGSRQASVPDVAAGTTGLEIVLPELGRLGLRVLDEATRDPLASYQVHWRTSSPSPEGYESLQTGGRGAAPGPGGIFVAELPLGTVDLLVDAIGEGWASVALPGRRVDRSDPPPVEEVVLPRGTKVLLRFLPAAGEANAGMPRPLQHGQLALAGEGEKPGEGDRAKNLFLNAAAMRGRAIYPGRGGTAELRAVEPGRYRFEGVPEGIELEPREILVPAAPEASFEIRWRMLESGEASEEGG